MAWTLPQLAAHPQAPMANAKTSRKARRPAAASMPAWCPNTHTNHTTVANSGKARACLTLAIHAPGRGSLCAQAGIRHSSR